MADWIEIAKLLVGGAGAAGIATLAKLYHDRVVAGKNNELVLKDAEIARVRAELARAERQAGDRREGAAPELRDLGRLREQLTQALERLARRLGAQAASLYVPVHGGRDDGVEFPRGFAFIAACNVDPAAAAAVLRLKLVESWTIVGECWAKDAVIGDNRLQDNSRHMASYDKQTGFVPAHTLVAPVHWQNRPVGVLQLFNRTRDDGATVDPAGFDSGDRRLLQEVLQDDGDGGIADGLHRFRANGEHLRFLGLQGEVDLENAAILCLDLSRSSSLFDELPLVDAARLINRFNANVHRRAAPYLAVVEKFSGDGALLRFHYGGYDDEGTGNNPAFRAVCAAADLVQDFRGFKPKQWKTLADEAAGPIKLRIAIALGPVICTNVGPRQFQVPTVVGQCVNRAAKMVAHAPRDRDVVLVDDNTRKALLQVRREYADAGRPFSDWTGDAARSAVSLGGHEYFELAADAFRAEAAELRQGRQWPVA